MDEAWKVEEPKELAERTFSFARDVRTFVNELERSLSNVEDGKQLIRSSGSVAANYLEAQEAVSRREFIFRVKIARKEARESWLWLRLLQIDSGDRLDEFRFRLIDEAQQFVRILTVIAKKASESEK